MKPVISQGYPGHWLAVDDDTYDGPGSPAGVGLSIWEALLDLNFQLCETCNNLLDLECTK